MTKALNSTFAAAAAFFLSISVACAADAQTASPASASVSAQGLEEIIVTARKHKEDVQTVPVSITAFSGADLQMQSVSSINDLQTQVPSLFTQQARDDSQSLTFTMRGRKQNDVTLAVDPAIGLYVDGLSIPRTLGMAGALLDIARVEVLRGPQGTLYGRNTTGGAIGLYTNNPTQDFSGSFDVTGGNLDARNVVGIVNVPLADDLAARFVLERGYRDGYGTTAIGEPIGDQNSQYYRGKLRWTPSDTLDAVLSAHFESNRTHASPVRLVGLTPAGNGLPAGGPVALEAAAETGLSIPDSVNFLQSWVDKARSNFYDNGNTAYSFSEIRRWDVGLNVTRELPNSFEFHWISGAQGLSRDSYFGSPIPTVIYAGGFHTQDKYYSQELQLLRATPTLNWVAGLYGGYETGQDDTNVIFLPVLNPGVAFNDSGIRNSNAAAFAQATWEFVPTWRITSGARYSFDERRADDVALLDTQCLVPAPGVESTFTGAAQCPRTFKNTFREPTWLLSLDHRLTEQILLYTKVAKGYRSGGENESGAVELETFAPFGPEKNLEYEIGMKSEFLHDRVRLNVDAYRDNYTDLQVTTSFVAADGNVASAVTQAARARITGAEAEADVVITPHLTVHGSASFTDARYIHFVDITGDRSGAPFEVPRWTGTLSPRYIQPTSVGDLTLQTDYAWKSTTVLDGTAIYRSQVTQGGYGLLNARANLGVTKWNLDVAIFGRNITAKKYLNQASAHDSNIGINLAYFGEPAIYGMEVIKKF
jgi:iron complex outermembrane recepter protein